MIVAAVTLVMLATWSVNREGLQAAQHWPSPEEVDSLSRYLGPVGAAPELDAYEAFVPAADAPDEPYAPVSQPLAPPPTRRLSAIMIGGPRPVAIIDNRQVGPGDRLDGGGIVESITRDRVIVRERNGQLRTLSLSANDGPL
jgi:hypothetical protein